MIKSMTAYGRGEVETPSRSGWWNSRASTTAFWNSPSISPGASGPSRTGSASSSRAGWPGAGWICSESWENLEEKSVTLRLDKAMVAGVRGVLEQLRLAGSTPESLKLEHFLHFSDLMVGKEQANQDLELEATWETASQAVNRALDLLEEMRLTEGAALAADLAGHLEDIRREVSRILVQAPRLPELWREKMANRLAELFPEGSPVDEARLAQEVALMAERRDVAEELARLESHMSQFQETLESEGPVGRKQEFLLQEMLREANTIGSKSGDLAVSQSVLEIKGSLERLREQVQNIE